MSNECISTAKNIIRDEKVLVELFNENYINNVEISSGNIASSLENIDWSY